MNTVTLDEVKAAQTKIAAMITALEASQPRVIENSVLGIELMPGEHYAGLIVGKNGERSYHLVLVPGAVDSVTWAKAKEFAKDVGGDLPTRREQALLYANCKEQFEEAWYWSSEEHASDSGYAWMQAFDDGNQDDHRKYGTYRARAVRRLPI